MSISILKKISIFSGLNDEELEAILKLTSSKKYSENNEIIIKEGESADSFYMISKGKVKVTREDENGKVVVVSILGVGDFFGETSLIDNSFRSANVVSMINTEVLTLSGKDFLNLVKKNSRISFNLIKVLCARIRKLDTQMKRLFTDEYFW